MEHILKVAFSCASLSRLVGDKMVSFICLLKDVMGDLKKTSVMVQGSPGCYLYYAVFGLSDTGEEDSGMTTILRVEPFVKSTGTLESHVNYSSEVEETERRLSELETEYGAKSKPAEEEELFLREKGWKPQSDIGFTCSNEEEDGHEEEKHPKQESDVDTGWSDDDDDDEEEDDEADDSETAESDEEEGNEVVFLVERTHQKLDADEDTDWSDEGDDDEDPETAAQNLELWRSFSNPNDPYSLHCFSVPISSRANAHDKKTQIQASQVDTKSKEVYRPAKAGKTLRFSSKDTVRPLVAWAFASRAARDGSCWLQMARDRDRFRRRVEVAEKLLAPCLSSEHRQRMWTRLHRETSL